MGTELDVDPSVDSRTYRIWRKGLHLVPPILIRQETHLWPQLLGARVSGGTSTQVPALRD